VSLIDVENCTKNFWRWVFSESFLNLILSDKHVQIRRSGGDFVQFDPTYPSAWIQFAGLERGLMETERARAIYEMAIAQADLYDPECVWKAYIDFEEEEEEWDRARDLFERLALASGHVKVWTSWAKVNPPSPIVSAIKPVESFMDSLTFFL
jgi:tetratricopeptide (TPR) repeat protein